MRRAAMLLAATLCAVSAAAEPAERRAVFDDWIAVCRADGSCFAESFAGTELMVESTLRIEQRETGAGYRMVFTAMAPTPMADSKIIFATIGRIIATVDASDVVAGPDGRSRRLHLEGEIVDRSMMMFMELEQPMSIGLEPERLLYVRQLYSLRGVMAALAWFEQARAIEP